MRPLLLILLLGLLIYVFRRRVKVALLVGGALYAGVLLVRLTLEEDLGEVLMQVLPEVALLGGVWLTLWLAVQWVERRRPAAIGRSNQRRS